MPSGPPWLLIRVSSAFERRDLDGAPGDPIAAAPREKKEVQRVVRTDGLGADRDALSSVHAGLPADVELQPAGDLSHGVLQWQIHAL